jgi:hypothetical protein
MLRLELFKPVKEGKVWRWQWQCVAIGPSRSLYEIADALNVQRRKVRA